MSGFVSQGWGEQFYPGFVTLKIFPFELPNAHQIQYREWLTDGQTLFKASRDLISKQQRERERGLVFSSIKVLTVPASQL